MISIRAVVVMVCVLFGLSMAAPGGWGHGGGWGGGGHSKHIRIIVPHHVHTVHHHHVSKVHVPVHIPVPVIKKVIIPVETHHDYGHHDHGHHDDWHGGWW